MAKSNVGVVWVAAVMALSAPLLGACGGGGGGTTVPPVGSLPPPPPPPPTNNNPTWTKGTFEAASSFKDQCESPRSGVDIEGNSFPDTQGTLVRENFWLRSWTNETYLWNDQVTDQDPATFTDRLQYFAQLKTVALTASGEDLDDFHFSEPTTSFLERRNSAASSGYGVRFVVFSNTVPRDFRVQYTEPNSPASAVISGQVNLPRGTKILEIDGVSLVNGGSTQAELDTLNNGLFPPTAGASHTFLVQDVGSASTRSITLTSADIAQAPVNRMSTIDTPTGKVGYILFNTFSPFESEQAIANAMAALDSDNVTDLVLDLRYNGGGLLAVAAQLSYMIAGDTRTNGKTFELLQFNAAAGNVNPVTGATNSPVPFHNTGLGFSLANGTPLQSLDLPRVYILSTGGTCSASEAVINGLRGIDVEIILIGDVTCGKPYGFFPTDNCGETFFTIQFRGVNEKNFGDYSDGFVPNNSSFGFGVKVSGCVVPDDFTHELGDVNEGLLAAALNFRATGTCPAIVPKVSVKASVQSSSKTTIAEVESDQAGAVFDSNRDMRMPY